MVLKIKDSEFWELNNFMNYPLEKCYILTIVQN